MVSVLASPLLAQAPGSSKSRELDPDRLMGVDNFGGVGGFIYGGGGGRVPMT